ncbi:MAG TPA: hypothetical protein VKU00_11555 [Chthonomonadaceae bacterium]|nr:hypothetical protein [Chthonomonadaceae bacterium]
MTATLRADRPIPVIVTESAVEVLALRNLLRNVARQLEPGGDLADPQFRQSMAEHIEAVLSGAEPNDFLTCAICGQPPVCCRCHR